jgi:uncharacterized protein
MLLVDTSAWVEWLIASPVGKKLAPKMPERDGWHVTTIVQLELAKWATRELTEEKADQIVAFSQKCIVAPLDTSVALAAAALCRQHKLATADAIVYATAQAHSADLLTCDAHFESLPRVTYVAKHT